MSVGRAGLLLMAAACAGTPHEPMATEAAPAAVAPEPQREAPPPGPATVAAERLRGRDIGALTAGWPRRRSLPKPEGCYAVALLREDLASDGWKYEILIDLETPDLFWIRATGSILGSIEYRGPATFAPRSR